MEPYVQGYVQGTRAFESLPRFFFQIRCNHQNLSRDELGLDFPDVETARGEVLRAAQDLEGEFAPGAKIRGITPFRSRMP
jgi:hypothetical protein